MSHKRLAAAVLSAAVLSSSALLFAAHDGAQASSQVPTPFSLPFISELSSGSMTASTAKSIQVASVIESNPASPFGGILPSSPIPSDLPGETFTLKAAPGALKTFIQVLPQSSNATSLFVNGVEVLRLHDAYQQGVKTQETSHHRVLATAIVLRQSLTQDLDNGNRIRLNAKAPQSLLIGNTPLVSIDPASSESVHEAPEALALLYANRLRAALGHSLLEQPTTQTASVSSSTKALETAAKDAKKVTVSNKTPLFKKAGKGQTGMASWYGGRFHGRRTASGKRFNQYGLTAAHRTLPFGTLVRVVNQHNHKSCIVQITDRGPYAHGRIIDLSKGAAQAIHMNGVAKVALEVVQRV
jgi:rare lipoprotein A